MLSPTQIMTWLETNVKDMRKSRLKTLAAVVEGAMAMGGLGVLALGRAMNTRTTAKHNIKRVNGFLGNASVETIAVARAVFDVFAPRQGRVLVLADWTDVCNGKMLIFALPCSGRALPLLSVCVPKEAGEGILKAAEEKGLHQLAEVVGDRGDVALVTVADRGFGNRRWIKAVRQRGWHYVQRLAGLFFAEVEDYIGTLSDMGIRRGAKPRDWGGGIFGEKGEVAGRLITVFDKEAKEPWYLVTDLDDVSAAQAVGIYRKRMWIEALFRDCKNRDWGLRLDAVKLKDYRRYERLFVVFALAFIFLTAFGAAAEHAGFDRGFKANTAKHRVINLIRMGFRFLSLQRCTLEDAVTVLRTMPATVGAA
jgi:hypothetical protein